MSHRSINKNKCHTGIEKKWPRMTTIIGGKCVDGALLISDRKLTYSDRPTEYIEKTHCDRYPIVTSAAGGSNAYSNFRNKLLPDLQPEPKPGAWQNMQVSGIIEMISNKPEDSYSYYTEHLSRLVKEVNQNEADYDKILLLVGMQLKDRGAILLQFNEKGYPIEERKYIAIGSGESYTYVFLKPFYRPDITMREFARLGYFTIKYMDRFEIDEGSGLSRSKPFDRPQIWFIPDSGRLYHGDEHPDLIGEFESDTNKMLDNLEQKGLSVFLQ
jgi:20S proteasome alpha/beta subunit